MSPVFFPLLMASAMASASPVYGRPDCRIGALLPVPADEAVTWSGACKDGFADGPGILGWNDADNSKRRIEGTLARGSVAGDATLTWEQDPRKKDGSGARHSYVGTLRNGQPEGQGFFRYAYGDMYEGDVVDGEPEGAGIYVTYDRSRYEGQWVKGKREGYGKATFALGGSYDGEWKNDQFNGAGTIVFAGTPRTWQGQFQAGRPEGAPASGRTTKGKFTTYSSSYFEPDSKRRLAIGTSFVPPQASWSELTPEQQNLVKTFYRALAPGDEPPYPVHGIRSTSELIGQVGGSTITYHGYFSVLVLVGADGKARSVSLLNKVTKEIAQYFSAAIMSQPYKPAMCQGQPCEMLYPINFFME